jgi:hypothetical protein
MNKLTQEQYEALAVEQKNKALAARNIDEAAKAWMACLGYANRASELTTALEEEKKN